MNQKTFSGLVLLIFAASGFSGLIYESIWTHYLKLFLGHAAYAQTLVLAIFMGGMALGSWVCSRYSARWKNLLIGYAVVEAVIGVCALLFHPLFEQAIQFSYAGVLPRLETAFWANAYKWTLSSLLILPQSVLLGMTFPLMSGGVLRLQRDKPGRIIALLYFANSLGAAIGVLASGFLLIRLAGLPGTIGVAGLINLILALAVWLLVKKGHSGPVEKEAAQLDVTERPKGRSYALLLLVALLTGAASFMYEIGWIRMLGLVMGSSTHSFELMLSAFILGLALGGLWIKNRIDGIAVPERFLAYVQVAMGLFALSTLLMYGQTFNVMGWLVRTLAKTDSGYLLFNLSSNAIALAVMLPATFCAGMTLPLITSSLLRRGNGERSIGAVYAANTLGAILGVFFAIHVGMPLLGVKGLIIFGAGCDIALGVLLLRFATDQGVRAQWPKVALAGACVLVTAFLFFNLNPYKMASEVYRSGALMEPGRVDFLYYRDGKTATISSLLEKDSGVVSINTNGKTDASIGMAVGGQPSSDEPTMILAAVLPMALHPQARQVANIGLGSGLTTQTLLDNLHLTQVDTIEIEKFMVEAAKNFRPRVDAVYTDPRSRIFIEDAKTFFSAHNKKYDIIISEPSNPWVSGVAGLFSEEFYRLLNRHLADDGIFVQWLQMYEVDNDLATSVLKAVSNNFSDFAVYASNDVDMLIVAKKKGTLPELDPATLKMPGISAALKRIYVNNQQDLELRKMGSKSYLSELLGSSAAPANSDYYPYVDQSAARTRFLQSDAFEFHTLSNTLLPLFEMLTGSEPKWSVTEVSFPTFLFKLQSAYIAMVIRDYTLTGSIDPRYGNVPPEIRQKAGRFRELFYGCRAGADASSRHGSLFAGAVAMIPYLRPPELEAVWKKLEAGPCAQSLLPAERQWIALFKAVGTRDAAAISLGAGTILANGQPVQPDALRFVVAAGMAGSLMQDDREGSLALWTAYRNRMFGNSPPDLMFRLLEAESRRP